MTSCDQTDDDCGGRVDEFVVEATTCGLGACYVDGLELVRHGTPVSLLRCQLICDGVDNDCNGQVDDELGATTCGENACLHEQPVRGWCRMPCDYIFEASLKSAMTLIMTAMAVWMIVFNLRRITPTPTEMGIWSDDLTLSRPALPGMLRSSRRRRLPHRSRWRGRWRRPHSGLLRYDHRWGWTRVFYMTWPGGLAGEKTA